MLIYSFFQAYVCEKHKLVSSIKINFFLPFLQNIEETKVYKVSMYIRSSDSVGLTVSLTSSDGLQNLASHTIM